MSNLELENKILNGLERISETLKALLWEKAKLYGLSPIQIQILLFISNHRIDLCNVSYLAKEFNVTKATISDAVKMLLKKRYIKKDFSPIDKRRYNLMPTNIGNKLAHKVIDYAKPISDELSVLKKEELANIFQSISKLIYQLNQKDIIQVQRTCFKCKFYSGNKRNKHYCELIQTSLKNSEIRLDCNEFELLESN